MSAFEKLAPFIQDYIYRNHWEELRDVQVAACDVVFNTNKNLLISTPTASGKTEAAFLPAITEIYNKPSSSVGILYIAPLKALINDQFIRIEKLLEEEYIPVTKWHGDASRTNKNKLLRSPAGVMQTTPESLEAMVMKRKQEVISLFSDLRFIIIDEVHNFIGEDRGIQLMSVLERIQNMTNNIPRRIGLSATLGNIDVAKTWLNAGANNECVFPDTFSERRKSQIMISHFYTNKTDMNDKSWNVYAESLYNMTRGKKSIIFSNSREDTEFNINRLKLLAEKKKERDVFHVHHGNISAELREYTEEQMKNSDLPLVTGATVTLELGIDLGDLDRIIQTGCPHSVSSLAQRLGRSGRRGGISQMCFIFNEDYKKHNVIFYKTIDWLLVKCIALVELYRENWIESAEVQKYPFNILAHQTISFLYGYGEIEPVTLAQKMLKEAIFRNIEAEDYKKLLRFMMEKKVIEKTLEGKIALGEKGEWIGNNYEFYTVFENPITYSVREGGQEIGTLDRSIPVGERFVLNGKTWEVLEIDEEKGNMYVKFVGGKSTVQWFSDDKGIEYTKVLKKMRNVLISDEEYGYLHSTALERLREIRSVVKSSGLHQTNILQTFPDGYGIFPWLGTKALNALKFALVKMGFKIDNANSSWYLITVKDSTERDIIKALKKIAGGKMTINDLSLPDKFRAIGKYGNLVPEELIRKQFVDKYVDIDEMQREIGGGISEALTILE
jgi:ATP-dependent Lhr-like helicase